MDFKKFNPYFRNTTIIILVVLFLFIALANRIIKRVSPGHIGVLYHFIEGTQTDMVYSEGYKIIWPVNTMYIYHARKQVIKQMLDVLTKDGLRVEVEVDTRFRPIRDSLGVIHKHLGPDYPEVVLKPEVESSVRNVISRYDPQELYTLNRAQIENEIVADCIEEFLHENIIVHDIMIKSIKLPPLIAHAIESKLEQEQKNLEYKYRLMREMNEADRKRIESEGIRDFEATAGISILTWKGIDATVELSKSDNSKIIVIGNDAESLPLILNTDTRK